MHLVASIGWQASSNNSRPKTPSTRIWLETLIYTWIPGLILAASHSVHVAMHRYRYRRTAGGDEVLYVKGVVLQAWSGFQPATGGARFDWLGNLDALLRGWPRRVSRRCRFLALLQCSTLHRCEYPNVCAVVVLRRLLGAWKSSVPLSVSLPRCALNARGGLSTVGNIVWSL